MSYLKEYDFVIIARLGILISVLPWWTSLAPGWSVQLCFLSLAPRPRLALLPEYCLCFSVLEKPLAFSKRGPWSSHGDFFLRTLSRICSHLCCNTSLAPKAQSGMWQINLWVKFCIIISYPATQLEFSSSSTAFRSVCVTLEVALLSPS